MSEEKDRDEKDPPQQPSYVASLQAEVKGPQGREVKTPSTDEASPPSPGPSNREQYGLLVGSKDLHTVSKSFVQFLGQTAALVWRSDDPQYCWLKSKVESLDWTTASQLDKQWESYTGIKTASLIHQALEFIKLHALLYSLPRLSTHVLNRSLCTHFVKLLATIQNISETGSNQSGWPKNTYFQQREVDLKDLRKYYFDNRHKCA